MSMVVMRFSENMYIRELNLQTIRNKTVTVPDGEKLVHLQFRRFAGCPVCNLHLQSFARRRGELERNNINEVILFHSHAEDLLKYASDFPFHIVPDPFRRLYVEFGVESSLRALIHPKALFAIVKSVGFSLFQILFQKKKMPPIIPYGGNTGLPADFLIDRDGKVLAVKYGTHANDQWSVDEIISKARHHNIY
jgi:peroxiredoxin